MPEFQGIFQARDALLGYIIDRTGHIPDDMRDRLRGILLQPSPAAGTCEAVELIYARRDEVEPDLLAIAADATDFAAAGGLWELDKDSRGGRMALVMRALGGNGPGVPEGEEPEALERYRVLTEPALPAEE